MKHSSILTLILAFILIGAIVVATGCDSATVSPDDQVADIRQDLGATAAQHAASRSTANVYSFADVGTPIGASSLVRNRNGVTATLRTTELLAGHAYTLWWVVFNEPSACAPDDGDEEIEGVDCSAADLGKPAVKADVLFATGHVVGGSGKGNFAARLNEGDTDGSLFPPPSAGLIDAAQAEIHLVVRSHGPAIPGEVNEQIRSFGGGCTAFLDPPAVPGEEGECADVQFAVHAPSE